MDQIIVEAFNAVVTAFEGLDTKEALTAVGIVSSLCWNFLNSRNLKKGRRRDVVGDQFKVTVEMPLRSKLSALEDLRDKIESLRLADKASVQAQAPLLNQEFSGILVQLSGLCDRLDADDSVCRARDWRDPIGEFEDIILGHFDTVLNSQAADDRTQRALAGIEAEINGVVAAFNQKLVSERDKIARS